ncbi:MAG: 3-oxoacyl-[acyl-carrier-protein] synthase III C-terminal domain-containing protein, partial [Acidaminococcaceae bacterium]
QPAGGTRKPATHETVDAREHFIHMSGNEVFKFAIKIMGKTALRTLENAGLTKDDIDLLVPHQANIRIINSAAKRLHLPMEKVMVNVDKYGNTSAASIPIALCEAKEQGRLKQGENVLLVGFGAGLTWASIVMKWDQ